MSPAEDLAAESRREVRVPYWFMWIATACMTISLATFGPWAAWVTMALIRIDERGKDGTEARAAVALIETRMADINARLISVERSAAAMASGHWSKPEHEAYERQIEARLQRIESDLRSIRNGN